MKSIIYPLVISIGVVLLTFGAFQSMEQSFSDILHLLKDNPMKFGLVSFLILASDIILPVPSSIVLYINGYFLGPLLGALISLAGLMVGCVIGYYIGKTSSNLFKSDRNQKAQEILSKYGPSAIFLSRGIPVLSESICFVCGYNKLDFSRYLFFNLIGYIPVCLLYALFGSMGYMSSKAFLLSFTASIVVSVVFWFFGKRLLPGIMK